MTLDILAQEASKGDKRALEELVRQVQTKIHALSVRMLYNLQDAEDATQEILLKIITHLSRFKGKSAFTGTRCVKTHWHGIQNTHGFQTSGSHFAEYSKYYINATVQYFIIRVD
jgi:hypothetical protein